MNTGRKKIFHIIQSLGNGGCENMLLRTLPLLDQFDHTIVTLKEPGALAPHLLSAGIRVMTVECHGLLDFLSLSRLRQLLKKENPALILTYLFHADVVGRCILQGITPSHPIPFLRTTYNHPKYWIARLFEWLTRPLVPRYLANSQAIKDFYSAHLGIRKEKITVIPNGIDTEYFETFVPPPTLRQSLGIAPNEKVITCVANLHSNKGHTYLLEAFEQIYPKHNDTKLLLIGDGTEKAALEHQITSYASKQNVLFLGTRTDVPALLTISHLFILPTLFEGMSNAIMEAMACGVPVITTAIKENEALIQHERTGILVPPKNSEALKKALETLWTHPERMALLGEHAKKHIRENFSLARVTKQWNAFLNNQISL